MRISTPRAPWPTAGRRVEVVVFGVVVGVVVIEGRGMCEEGGRRQTIRWERPSRVRPAVARRMASYSDGAGAGEAEVEAEVNADALSSEARVSSFRNRVPKLPRMSFVRK